MSFQILADVFALVESRDDLTNNEVLILLALANRTNKVTGTTFPSLKNLQKTAKLTTRTIRSVLRNQWC